MTNFITTNNEVNDICARVTSLLCNDETDSFLGGSRYFEMENESSDIDLFVFPSPAGIAAVGLASAMGAMQVAAIAKQKFQTSASSNPAISNATSGGSVQAPDFNIVGASQTNQIAEAIQGKLQTPIKAYVVSKDVSTAQEMDRNIIGSASLG